MVPLTEPDPSFYLRGGQLHPNGRWLVYGANVDPATGEEIEQTCVYRHDLDSGERALLARPAKGGSYVPQLNQAGSHILYSRKDLDPSGRQVWLVDIEGRSDREILNFGPAVKVQASWFPDSRRVLVLTEHGSYRRLGVWDLETAALRWVIDDPSRNLERAWVPIGSERAVIVEVRQARPYVTLLDVGTGVEEPFSSRGENLVPVAPAAGRGWVAQRYGATHPADLVRYFLDGNGDPEYLSLTRVWEQVRKRHPFRPELLTEARERRWRSVDGLEVHGWYYRARGPVKGTIVFAHGGPTAHSEDRLNPLIQFLTHEGFHVLDPNYRGSTGYGLEFQEAIKQDGWGGREQDDLRAGIEALIAQGIAEAGKVGITGTSYGGYSSWCAITHWPPEIVAASAPVCGMTDLVVDYETTRPDLRPYSEEMMGGSPEQVPERYRERSPIHFVGDIRGKLLIVQGLQDPNVSPENVRAVETALAEAGIQYEVLTFDDEGHGIIRPHNQKTLYLRLAEFFTRAFAGADHGTQ
jgi:dipeptidyl aminopeptidase/acylaminoacyl peptidase